MGKFRRFFRDTDGKGKGKSKAKFLSFPGKGKENDQLEGGSPHSSQTFPKQNTTSSLDQKVKAKENLLEKGKEKTPTQWEKTVKL